MHRRDFLRFSLSTPLGLSTFSGLSHLAQAAPSISRRLKPVIVLFLAGGPPRQETFDPCPPDAPAEYRGARKRIETSIRGVYFSDYFPKLAAVAHRCAVLRGLDSESGDHFESARRLLLGTETKTLGIRWGERAANCGPPYVFIQVPSFYPLMGACQVNRALAVRWKRNGEGTGATDWERDLSCAGSFVGPPNGSGVSRERVKLLRAFDTARIDGPAAARRDANRDLALELLRGGGGRFSLAFKLPTKDVERYGNNVTGKGLLLARRLVEAGAGFTMLYNERGMGWDVHSDMYKQLTVLAGETDRATAALVEDIGRERLDCLFVIVGEFGRTPRVNASSGRDHWGEGFPAIFCGARTRSGIVHGRTHHTGRIIDGRVPARDFGPTIYHLAGGEKLLSPAVPRVREVIR